MVLLNSFVSGRKTYFSPKVKCLSDISLGVLCASPLEASAELESYSYENLFND